MGRACVAQTSLECCARCSTCEEKEKQRPSECQPEAENSHRHSDTDTHTQPCTLTHCSARLARPLARLSASQPASQPRLTHVTRPLPPSPFFICSSLTHIDSARPLWHSSQSELCAALWVWCRSPRLFPCSFVFPSECGNAIKAAMYAHVCFLGPPAHCAAKSIKGERRDFPSLLKKRALSDALSSLRPSCGALQQQRPPSASRPRGRKGSVGLLGNFKAGFCQSNTRVSVSLSFLLTGASCIRNRLKIVFAFKQTNTTDSKSKP